MGRSFDLSEFLYLLRAIPWTLLLSLGALLGGGILGLLIAILRTAPSRPLRWLAIGYIELFQGTPVLMQLFVVYYGLAVLFNLQVDPWPAVLLAFTLYSSAFLGEIWRGCIEAVPRPQWEAAECLALSRTQRMVKVILPQAIRIATPPTVGFMVQIIKNTSLASVVGFVELMRSGQIVNNSLFEPFMIYAIIAVTYFAMCYPLSLFSQKLERRMGRGRINLAPA
jgi:polar amino acid transport system permease protein